MKILQNKMCSVNDLALMLFPVSHKLNKKIARKTMLEMIVLYPLIEPIFVLLMLEDDSIVTSTVHWIYDMKLLFAF